MECHILTSAGLEMRDFNTEPIFDNVSIVGWKKQHWAPKWAVALVRYHRREREAANSWDLQKRPVPLMVAEVGYKEMIDLMRQYKDGDEDSVLAALAVASLCEDPSVANLARDALRKPLEQVKLCTTTKP